MRARNTGYLLISDAHVSDAVYGVSSERGVFVISGPFARVRQENSFYWHCKEALGCEVSIRRTSASDAYAAPRTCMHARFVIEPLSDPAADMGKISELNGKGKRNLIDLRHPVSAERKYEFGSSTR